jgi:bacteriocin biosynthesis cyclodehydratase domain-containing protein
MASIVVVADDPFGEAIAERLRLIHCENISIVATPNDISVETDTEIIIFASLHRCDSVCERLNDISFARKLMFVPIWFENALLTIGPVVKPQSGACWTCYSRRVLQHTKWPDVQTAISQFYSDMSVPGPLGYLGSHVTLSAGVLISLVSPTPNVEIPGGTVVEINILNLSITRSVIVGVHGCHNCGLKRERGDRSWIELAEKLSYLWPSGKSDE